MRYIIDNDMHIHSNISIFVISSFVIFITPYVNILIKNPPKSMNFTVI